MSRRISSDTPTFEFQEGKTVNPFIGSDRSGRLETIVDAFLASMIFDDKLIQNKGKADVLSR